MSLSIGLRVDAAQVKQAKRDLEWLNKTARETESLDISLGGDELAKDAEMLRRVGLELTRLGNLARTGENRGGFLNPKQFEQVSKLSKDIGTNLGSWTAQTQKLRNELKQVTGDLRQLQRDMTSPGLSAKARDLMLEDVEVLTGRREDLQKELSRRSKLDARAGYMGRRAQEYTDTISGFGVSPDQQNAISIKKMLGYGLALWGGASILGMLRESWEKFKSQSEMESGLAVRGVQYSRRLSDWNYTPQEEAEYAMSLRRGTGASDMETLGRFERFARLSNLDAGTALGFAGSYYGVTGADANKQRQALDALLYMGKQAKDGRTEVLLQNINQNLQTAFHAQGGKALSDSQVGQIMAQTVAAYNSGGTQGMSTGMFDKMQNALLPGGDNIDEMLSWAISGGFKKGPLTSKDLVEIQRRRAKGLNDPQNRKAAMDLIRKFGGNDRNTQILFAQKILKQLNVPGGVETAEWFIDNYDRLQGARMPSGATMSGDIDSLAKLYQETPGFDVGQRAAQKELIKLEAGKGLESVLGPIEDWVLTGSSSVLKAAGVAAGGGSRQARQYDSLIQEKAKKYNISPSLLKAILHVETGGTFNRFAYNKESKAKGIGQFMSNTGPAYGLRSDSDYYDPEKSIDASAHYLSDLKKMFGGDETSVILSYHAGPNNFKSGKIGPRTRDYLSKVQWAQHVYGDRDKWDTTNEGWTDAAGGRVIKNIFGELTAPFREIASNLGRVVESLEVIASRTQYGGEVRKPMPARPK